MAASPSTTGSSINGPRATTYDPAQLKAQDLAAAAVFESDPDFQALLKKAVAKGYSTDQFVAELMSTPYYRKTADSAREWSALEKADPATAKRQLAITEADLRQQAAQQGVTLSDQQLKTYATQVHMFGWDQAQIQYALSSQLTHQTLANYGGNAAQTLDTLRKTYSDYGLQVGDGTLAARVRNVNAGVTDINTYIEQAKNQAKTMYAGAAHAIDAGVSVRDVADPFIQQMASTLEVDANTLNVNDPTIRKALQYVDPSQMGKPGVEPALQPLWHFEQQLKDDPRWLKTNNAQKDTMDAAHQVLTDWGFTS
jgi:hypothetical protein